MKKILLISIAICFSSCQPQTKEQSDNIASKNRMDTIPVTPLAGDSCDCSKLDSEQSFLATPRFQNSDYIDEVRKRNDLEWRKFSNDSVRLMIKSIELSNYDTIPDKFRIFQNVEKIRISTRQGIKGLDNFPKLREVEFFGSVVTIDTSENWLKRIERLTAEKTNILQLKSFRSLPNLVTLKMAFSGFEQFPSDIESLNCLQEIEFGAYMFGQIDLGMINLAKFRCLKKATFHTWYESLRGIPRGISDPGRIIELEVSHKNLTSKEKLELRQYSSRFKKASH